MMVSRIAKYSTPTGYRGLTFDNASRITQINNYLGASTTASGVGVRNFCVDTSLRWFNHEIAILALYLLVFGTNPSAYAEAPTASVLQSQPIAGTTGRSEKCDPMKSCEPSQSVLSSIQPKRNSYAGPPPAPKISMQDALRIACDLRAAYCSHGNSLLVLYVHDKRDLKTVNDLTEYESSWGSNFLGDGPVWVFALRLKMRPMQRGDNSLLLIDAKNGKLRLEH
jgi:hypothetical protein